MYITLSVAAVITVIIVFVAVCVQKNKEINSLSARLREQEEQARTHRLEAADAVEAEKRRRDLVEIAIVTDASPTDCEKIYAELIESGAYLDFYNAGTREKKSEILQNMKKSAIE